MAHELPEKLVPVMSIEVAQALAKELAAVVKIRARGYKEPVGERFVLAKVLARIAQEADVVREVVALNLAIVDGHRLERTIGLADEAIGRVN